MEEDFNRIQLEEAPGCNLGDKQPWLRLFMRIH